MNQAPEEITQLIHACLDGCATLEQSARLNARLRTDAAARDLYLQMADMHSCLAVDETLWSEPTASESPSENAHLASPRRLAWRPMAAAAAGILFGMFCTSVVFAYVAPALGKGKVVFRESFETGVAKTMPGLPLESGVWAGDEASVVSSAPEVKPRSGGKMLRLLSATYLEKNAPRSQWGDVYRVVDVRGVAGAGRAVMRISASFAQGVVSGSEQFSCSVEAFVLDQDLTALPSPLTHPWLQQNNSASGSRTLALTSAREWKDVFVEVPVTSETRFVLLHLAVMQNAPAVQAGVVQFPAHYMDDVSVEVLSRP
jgi:hypothetical protein